MEAHQGAQTIERDSRLIPPKEGNYFVFDWNTVITNLAALTLNGISIYDHAPQFTQDCIVPALYPSYSPTVNLNSAEIGSACVEGDAFEIIGYTINYVYLHIETTQEIDNSQYEIAIRANMASIFGLVVQHNTTLGVYLVMPSGFSIAEKLIEVGGRTYLGGQVTLNVTEWNN